MSERQPTHYEPYELLASSMVTDFIKEFKEDFGNDPRVLASYLPILLSHFALECIQTGMDLAGSFPNADLIDTDEICSQGTVGYRRFVNNCSRRQGE